MGKLAIGVYTAERKPRGLREAGKEWITAGGHLDTPREVNLQ